MCHFVLVFLVLLVLRLPRLGKRELILVLFFFLNNPDIYVASSADIVSDRGRQVTAVRASDSMTASS